MAVSIRAVCFDLGGVVARIAYRWAEMLERGGFAVPDHIEPHHELASMPAFDAYQTGSVTSEAYFQAMAAYLGGLTLAEAEQIHRNILIEPFPGVLELVKELGARGIKTGCLSNTNAPHWQDLAHGERFPAIRAMDVRMPSFEIDASKPDPRAFRAFEAAVSCSGAEILLFDDSLANCEAARWLGWEARHIDPTGNPADQMRGALSELGVL